MLISLIYFICLTKTNFEFSLNYFNYMILQVGLVWGEDIFGRIGFYLTTYPKVIVYNRLGSIYLAVVSI